MNYSAYIFDFDYTLGDATGWIVAAAHHAAERMGFLLFSPDEIRKTLAMSLPDAFTFLTKDSDSGRRAHFSKLFGQRALQVMVSHAELLPGTRQVLTYLRGKGALLGIASRKPKEQLFGVLRKFELEPFFSVVVAGEDVENPKPHPESIDLAVDLLGVTRAEAVYVGDGLIDSQAARAAGLDFIGVTTGMASREELSRLPHVAIFNTLRELIL